MCLLHKNDTPPITIKISEASITSKPFMSVLGITFDTKLQWAPQVNQNLKNQPQLLKQFVLSKDSSTPLNYYNLSPQTFIQFYSTLAFPKNSLKQSLLSASTKALKLCMYYPDPYTSFIKIHEINKRALPADLMIYKHAIQLHKFYNSQAISNEWLHLNANQVLTSRQTTFIT